jgi:hypothetical protein
MSILRVALYFVLSHCLSPGPGSAPARAVPAGATYAAEVQAAMDVKPSDADVMQPLAEVMAAFNPKDRVANQSLPDIAATNLLVERLNAGANPNAYSEPLLRLVTLQERSEHLRGTGWTHGSHVRVSELAQLLFERAQELAAEQPERSAKCARAAVLLAAMTNFTLANVDLMTFMKEADFQQLLSLTDAQDDALREVVKTWTAQEKQFADALFDLHDERDAIRSAPQGKSLDPEIARRCEEAFVTAWNARSRNPSDSWRFCSIAKSIIQDVQQKGDAELSRRLRELVSTWSHSEPEGPVRSWLSEVVADPGR